MRFRVQINLSLRFARAVGSASNTSDDKVLYLPHDNPSNPISWKMLKKKRQFCYAVLCLYRSASPSMSLRVKAIHKKTQHNAAKS